jgi:RNA polymerase sigma-70 factor, ECF subfamily
MSAPSLPTRQLGWSESGWSKNSVDKTGSPRIVSRDIDASDAMAIHDVVLEEYDREHVAIRRYLAFSGISECVAEDAVQEAFLRLQIHLERGGERSNLRAWLYRVAHNLALHELQGARHRLSDPLENEAGTSKAVDPAGSPEQMLLGKERSDRVRTAIGQLPEVPRQCVVMRAQGLRLREIAEVLGLSVSTVSEHVQRGLQQVRETV